VAKLRCDCNFYFFFLGDRVGGELRLSYSADEVAWWAKHQDALFDDVSAATEEKIQDAFNQLIWSILPRQKPK
jgi:hypothetical protein